MRRLVLLLALLSPVFALPQIKDRVVRVPNQDDEMAAAVANAQATLDDCLRLTSAPPVGASQFKLKVKFPHAHGSEHMWVSPFQQTATGFTGTLADEPEYAKDVSNGQRVAFTRKDISDWGYVQSGKQKGSFTVCVLFKRMPAAEVRQYREQYGFEC